MAKSYDLTKYHPWSFDDDFCLKPPFLLTAAMVYLCRSFLFMLLIITATTRGSSSGGLEGFLPSGDHPMSIGLTGLPALLVLYARVRRSSKAGNFVRWIWRNGRALLGLSAVLELGSGALLIYANSGQSHDGDLFRFGLMILDTYILLYVSISRHVKDVFSDFPVP
jgi:hypothetical protein